MALSLKVHPFPYGKLARFSACLVLASALAALPAEAQRTGGGHGGGGGHASSGGGHSGGARGGGRSGGGYNGGGYRGGGRG